MLVNSMREIKSMTYGAIMTGSSTRKKFLLIQNFSFPSCPIQADIRIQPLPHCNSYHFASSNLNCWHHKAFPIHPECNCTPITENTNFSNNHPPPLAPFIIQNSSKRINQLYAFRK